MTPEELRSLADAPTEQVRFVGHPDFMEVNAILSALAPDLARLCAEIAAILYEDGYSPNGLTLKSRWLAKLSELRP